MGRQSDEIQRSTVAELSINWLPTLQQNPPNQLFKQLFLRQFLPPFYCGIRKTFLTSQVTGLARWRYAILEEGNQINKWNSTLSLDTFPNETFFLLSQLSVDSLGHGNITHNIHSSNIKFIRNMYITLLAVLHNWYFITFFTWKKYLISVLLNVFYYSCKDVSKHKIP